MLVRWMVLVVLWGAVPVSASPTTPLPAAHAQRFILAQTVGLPGKLSRSVLQMTDTFRAQMLGAIAQGSRFLGFEMSAGKSSSTVQVSELRMHVVVQVKDRFYDAFTGSAGLPTAEYLKRLVTEEGATITSQLVTSP